MADAGLGFDWKNACPHRNRKHRLVKMKSMRKTVIVTGGSHGIGAGLAKAFVDRGYNVVANALEITTSNAFEASDKLALVDGNIAEAATAAKIAEVAKNKFKSIDGLVNNAGTDGGRADAGSEHGGSTVNLAAAQVNHPIAGINSSVAMMIKGGLEAVTRSLAMEYAEQGIRVNAVASGLSIRPCMRGSQRISLRSGNRWVGFLRLKTSWTRSFI
jgi:NAD(P)-dependent dehydrogenase (short-subunit alcohol dehydrogenase family)